MWYSRERARRRYARALRYMPRGRHDTYRLASHMRDAFPEGSQIRPDFQIYASGIHPLDKDDPTSGVWFWIDDFGTHRKFIVTVKEDKENPDG